MYRNNRYTENTSLSSVTGNVDPSLSMNDLSQVDKELLQLFSERVTAKTQSYLPDSFHVQSGYVIANGDVTLQVNIDCPFGAILQNKIVVTDTSIPTENIDTNSEFERNQNTSPTINLQFRSKDGVENISQHITAAVATQAKTVEEQQQDTQAVAS